MIPKDKSPTIAATIDLCNQYASSDLLNSHKSPYVRDSRYVNSLSQTNWAQRITLHRYFSAITTFRVVHANIYLLYLY